MQKSEYGFAISTAASAIGLSNIWTFPYIARDNGLANFIILYVLCAITVGASLVFAELIMGRKLEDKNTVEAYARYEENILMKYIGVFVSITSIILLFFYPIVIAWAIKYIFITLSNHLPINHEMAKEIFVHITSDDTSVLFIFYGIILLTGVISYLGIFRGVMRVNIVAIPILFVIFIALNIYSITLSGFLKSVSFLLSFDLSKINEETIFAVLKQIFFSLSVGLSIMIAYSITMSRNKTNLVMVSFITVVLDTIFSLIVGLFIYTILFTAHNKIDSGTDLIFVELPYVFHQLSTSGNVISLLFFIGIFLAGFTTILSSFEAAISTFKYFHMDRFRTIVLLTLISIIFGTFSFLSLNHGYGDLFKINNKSFFDFISDYVSILGPILGVFVVSITIGWIMGKEDIIKLINSYKHNNYIFKIWFYYIKYILPICLIYLFYRVVL